MGRQGENGAASGSGVDSSAQEENVLQDLRRPGGGALCPARLGGAPSTIISGGGAPRQSGGAVPRQSGGGALCPARLGGAPFPGRLGGAPRKSGGGGAPSPRGYVGGAAVSEREGFKR